ncbi:MAG: glycosyltransferase family 4 protein, partial [Candidatus Hodarchaeota archaeon]
EKNTRILLKRADLIITPSNYMKNEIIRFLKIPGEKIRVVYHGVSKCFLPKNDTILISRIIKKYHIMTPYILFVGTFHKNKNLIRLLKAFRELKLSSKLQHQLVLAGGKGQLNQDIVQTIKELKIEDVVSLPGYVSDEDLPILYNGSDLFVFPSVFEGFGMPVLEAMACGVPVISSNFCSLPEVVGNASLLVDPLNVDLLAGAMHRILSNEELRNELIKKGLERVKQFTWEKTAKETIEIYREVCEE